MIKYFAKPTLVDDYQTRVNDIEPGVIFNTKEPHGDIF